MIVYDVKRPRPEVPVSVPYHQRTGLFERIRANRQRPPVVNLSPPINLNREPLMDHEKIAKELRESGNLETHSTMPPIGMGKHQYAKWLNDFVYPKFPKGTPVTFKNMPLVLNEPPKVWFYVVEIQEIHYMVQMDKDTREPKAVGITNSKYGLSGIPVWYPPALLRNLQPSEVQAIDRLRNQESEGRNVEATVIDGEAVLVDRDSGVVLKKESDT